MPTEDEFWSLPPDLASLRGDVDPVPIPDTVLPPIRYRDAPRPTKRVEKKKQAESEDEEEEEEDDANEQEEEEETNVAPTLSLNTTRWGARAENCKVGHFAVVESEYSGLYGVSVVKVLTTLLGRGRGEKGKLGAYHAVCWVHMDV